MPAPAGSATSGLAWALIGAAGGAGTLLRHAAQLAAKRYWGGEFPYGTLAVNVVGCVAIGVVAATLEGRAWLGVDLRVVVATGLLGGFTTYSAFNLEAITLAQTGQWARSIVYLTLTLLGCLLAGLGGLALGRLIRG